MKIIVTGGAGFIGGNFIHHMVNKYPEYDIVNLAVLTYAGNLETLKPVEGKPNYKFVKGDIADRKFVFDLFEKEKPDMVVNFAAESHVDRSVVDPESFVRTNVMGTTTLLDACKEYGIKRYHQVSTDEVYGDLPLDLSLIHICQSPCLHGTLAAAAITMRNPQSGFFFVVYPEADGPETRVCGILQTWRFKIEIFRYRGTGSLRGNHDEK